MTTATLIAPVCRRRSQLAETDAALISADVVQLIVSSIPQLLPHVVCVSFLVSISALVDRQGPHRQWRQVLLVFFDYSLDQCLVGQPLASHAVNETVKPRQGMILYVAFVQPEGKFVNIAAKMLFARVVVDAINAAFHDRENTLNAVRGHLVTDIFALAVINRIVIERKAARTPA
jgi:hypothetical protein